MFCISALEPSKGILSATQHPGNLKTPLLLGFMTAPLLHNPTMGAYPELWRGLPQQGAGLTSKPFRADVIRFGISVRYTLRVLVSTIKGALLVAACAGLSECYDQSTSALILNQIAKRFRNPRDLTYFCTF